MNRFDLLKLIHKVFKNNLIICNIGLPSQELYQINDQPNYFYMLGSMGLSSSIGLGLALSQNKDVISIDGDGSVLMNMNTLSTIGIGKIYLSIKKKTNGLDFALIENYGVKRKILTIEHQ